MKFISHRGNVSGPNKERENKVDYIQEAFNEGFDVEIDLWHFDGNLYLGHDFPETICSINFLIENRESLWIHAKNLKALNFLRGNHEFLNYFWHQNDDFTLTSRGFIWTFPSKQLTENSICVLPELYNDSFKYYSSSYGICSDYIKKYSSLF